MLTKVEGIIKVLGDNNGVANWKIIYDGVEKYCPNVKEMNDWKAGIGGVLYREILNNRNFKKIGDGIFSLLNFNENKLLIKDTNSLMGDGRLTEKFSTVLTRLKQNQLREQAVKKLKFCPFTKITDKRLLIASHIKPWFISDDRERLDLNNVFLFSPLYDKLFDRGLISFEDKKYLLISSDLSKETREKNRYCEWTIYRFTAN